MARRVPLIINIVTQMEAGGAQKAAIQVCDVLKERGWQSQVWFLYRKRPVYEASDSIRWVCDRRPSTLNEMYDLVCRLCKWFSEESPTGVITYTHYANVIGQAIAWSMGIPYRLATQRNPSWSYPFFARFLDKLWGTIGIYKANVFVSKSVAKSFDKYPRRYLARSHVILNGIQQPQPSVASKEEARRRFGLPIDATIVINVGRLAAQKNQKMLIEGIARVPNERVILAIAGDGEMRPQLLRLINVNGLERRVLLLGELPPSEIPNLLIAGDFFAFPSRYEAFGFALVEAMALGLPVLVSDIDAHKEIVGEAGIFLPIDDPLSWSRSIMHLSENADLRERLSIRAKERAMLYDLNRMVDGYIKALFKDSEYATCSPRHFC